MGNAHQQEMGGTSGGEQKPDDEFGEVDRWPKEQAQKFDEFTVRILAEAYLYESPRALGRLVAACKRLWLLPDVPLCLESAVTSQKLWRALPIHRCHYEVRQLALSGIQRSVDLSNGLLPQLTACPGLQQFSLRNFDWSFTDIAAIAYCRSLQRLELNDCQGVADVSVLAACPSLLKLSLRNCPKVADLTALAACLSLQQLTLSDLFLITDISVLGACTSVKELNLTHCGRVVDISALAGCLNLEQLSIAFCSGLTDISPLQACSSLRKLNLSNMSQYFTDITALAACASLQQLSLTDNEYLEDVTPLAACSLLQQLNLTGCRKLRDVSALAACASLQKLDLTNCEVSDVSALATCASLQKLDITNNCRGAHITSFALRPEITIVGRNESLRHQRR